MQKRKPANQKLSKARKAQTPKLQRRPKHTVFGRLKGKIQIVGDIVSPITPLEDWEALKD